MKDQIKPIRVGIVGLGRSGWHNHALTLRTLPEQFTVSVVTDPNPERCREVAEQLGCKAAPDLPALLADAETELVVIATPTQLHCRQTVESFAAGKNVVCEKPMASNAAEADQMIQAARRAGKVLTIFQNNRYMPSFVQLRKVIDSGKLGRIVQIRINIHSFGRRWDWQTLKEFSGGELNNTGSHFVDQALLLLGPAEPEIFCQMERTLTSGDTEDHAKLIFRAKDSPLIDMEFTRACAYPQNPWHVMGTSGGLVGSSHELNWKYIDISTLPPRPVVRTPTPDRSYNSEKYSWQEENWEISQDLPSTQSCFYQDLHKTLREDAPLTITPESVRRQIEILEKCREICPLP